MVASVNPLVHLCELGFPAHWISDYAQNVLADKLVTRAITAGGLPIPVGDINSSQQHADRELGLGPQVAELETILASAGRGLPPFVSVPAAKTVASWPPRRRKISESSRLKSGPLWSPGQCKTSSPFDLVGNLLFWKLPPSLGWDGRVLKEVEKFIEVDGVLLGGAGKRISSERAVSSVF